MPPKRKFNKCFTIAKRSTLLFASLLLSLAIPLCILSSSAGASSAYDNLINPSSKLEVTNTSWTGTSDTTDPKFVDITNSWLTDIGTGCGSTMQSAIQSATYVMIVDWIYNSQSNVYVYYSSDSNAQANFFNDNNGEPSFGFNTSFALNEIVIASSNTDQTSVSCGKYINTNTDPSTQSNG